MDSYTFTIQLVTALGASVPPMILAVVAMIKILRRVKEVHIAVNGRIDQLLIASNAAAVAKGRQQVINEIGPK